MARTTGDILSEVRSLLDEINEANLGDDTDLLPSINRGLDYALHILATHYVAPILTYKLVTLTSGQSEYDLPEDAFEERLLKMEVYNRLAFSEIMRLDYKDVTFYDVPTKTNVPYYYTVIGTKYRLNPPPTGTYPLRLWYAKHPGPLVKEQGQVTVIGSNYVIVQNLGDSISSTGSASYVNLVDGETGNVKATLQIQSIVGNKITFKGTPDRTSFSNRTVVGTLPTDLAIDDYVCSAEGTCIPVMRSTVTNFLVQFAVAEMTRKLGGEPTIEEKVKADFEEQIKRAWTGRERYTRVKKRSKEWGATGRRYWFNNSN